MRRFTKGRAGLLTAVAALGIAGAADASEILVSSNITTSTTWTANNTYNLQQQIYVTNSATLTIEAGTVIASTTDLGGSLAVCRGSQIFVQGSQAKPVIMTSTADVATWTGGNPKTGTWRADANEWGNLTIMGDAYISENSVAGNDPFPDPSNVANMEGLNAGPSTDQYGGGDDDDDSGSITYLSLRYGGKVIGLNNELNGLSIGGVGRDTDINHIDIMNNVDDGIEIWGGTVNLKYFNIWNVGDDSVDVDQGWRGKAQFGLIVQGYSVDNAQGSGVGDNCFETDGAEDADYQPVTTATIYNCTVIGQHADGAGNGGDHGTAWRDNARVQYRNCIFMDLGERLVSFDNIDGDGGHGYGFGTPATLSWAATWTTNYNAVPAHANDFTTGSYATNYAAQSSGKLAEIKDSVFYNNLHSAAYTTSATVGVTPGDMVNDNVVAGSSPIQSITRGADIMVGDLDQYEMKPVTSLDPRPANDALTSVASAPADGFFTSAAYRGAFDPACDQTWLDNWTASYAFGFTPTVSGPVSYCTAKTNSLGCVPQITSSGHPSASRTSGFLITTTNTLAAKAGLLFYSKTGPGGGPFQGGHICCTAPTKRTPLQTSSGTAPSCAGSYSLDFNTRIASGIDVGLVPGQQVWAQYWTRDSGVTSGTGLTNGLTFTICP